LRIKITIIIIIITTTTTTFAKVIIISNNSSIPFNIITILTTIITIIITIIVVIVVVITIIITTIITIVFFFLRTWGCSLVVEGTCSFPLHQGSNLTVHIYHPAVPYMLTGLAGCSVSPGISCGARKLVRTSRVTKKNIVFFYSWGYFEYFTVY